MPLTVPVMTRALAERIEEALSVQAASRLHHVERLPGNPLGVATRMFGPLRATAILSGTYHFPRYTGIRGVFRGAQAHVDAALDWLREQGLSASLPLSPYDADEPLLRHLVARGLRQTRFMTVLYAEPGRDVPPPPPALEVRRVPADDLADFLEIWRSDAPPAGWPALETLGRAEMADWQCYVAYLDGKPAGAGALYVHEGVAVMASGRTLPEYRGRGGQTAVLAHRVREAARAGCDVVVSHTAPGSISQRNVERVGLRVAWHQAMWLDTRPAA